MKLVHINAVGGDLYVVREFVAPVDPGYGIGSGLHPSHGLPGGGHVDNALPGAPGSPGNELPSGPPPVVPPNMVLVLVRDQAGVWHYATTAAPPTQLPEPPGAGVWPKPRPPHVSGGPIPQPPTAGQLPGGPPVAAPKA